MTSKGKKQVGDKVHYSYAGKCLDCKKQIATVSKRCRRCQGRYRSKLNTIKRRNEAFG